MGLATQARDTSRQLVRRLFDHHKATVTSLEYAWDNNKRMRARLMAKAGAKGTSFSAKLAFWRRCAVANAARRAAVDGASPAVTAADGGPRRRSCVDTGALLAQLLREQRTGQATLARQSAEQATTNGLILSQLKVLQRGLTVPVRFPTDRPPCARSNLASTGTSLPPQPGGTPILPQPLGHISFFALPACVAVDLPKRGHATTQLQFFLRRLVGTGTSPGLLYGMAACQAYAAQHVGTRLSGGTRTQIGGIRKLASTRKKSLQKTMRVAAWAVSVLNTVPAFNSSFDLTPSHESALVRDLVANCGEDPQFSVAHGQHSAKVLQHMTARQVREVLERCRVGPREVSAILQSPRLSPQWLEACRIWGVPSE